MRSTLLVHLLCLLGCGVEPTEPPAATQADPTSSTSTETTETSQTVSDTGDPSTTHSTTTAAPNYAVRGSSGFSTSVGSISTGGCQLAYTQFEPDDVAVDGVVVLSHGFMRNQGHVRGWAEHLATWGVPVVTPDLCHASAFDTDHPQNGLDLAALGAAMDRGAGTVYIGHSAGGLAALLAGGTDADALAVLGLDPVDASGLGLGAASGVQVPVRAILGDSSSCNAQSNGHAMTAAAPDHQVLAIPGADHCSFEDPTDVGCTLFCGGDGGALTAVEISDTVAALTTAYVLWQSGTMPIAADWWDPDGAWHQQLLSAGRIVEL